MNLARNWQSAAFVLSRPELSEDTELLHGRENVEIFVRIHTRVAPRCRTNVRGKGWSRSLFTTVTQALDLAEKAESVR